jgi:hypothetical protein
VVWRLAFFQVIDGRRRGSATRRHPRPVAELEESVARPDPRGGVSNPGDRLQSDLDEFIKEDDAPVVVATRPPPLRLVGSVVIDQGRQRFLY